MRIPRLTFERHPGALAQLDGIRALAITLVLVRHGVRAFTDIDGQPLTVGGWDVGGVLLNGWAGVDLFFVLSGFLITRSLVRSTSAEQALPDARRYLLKRVLRIVPAYVAVLLIAVAGIVPHYDVPDRLLGVQVAYHLLFLQDYLPSGIVVAFWSLGVEEKFYLLAPVCWIAVMRIGSRPWRYAAVASIGLLAVALRWSTYVAAAPVPSYEAYFAQLRSPFHLALDPLFFGVLVAMIYTDRHALPWTRRTAVVDRLFALSALGAVALLGSHELLAAPFTAFDAVLQPLLIALSFAGVVLAVALGGGPIRWLSTQRLFVVSKLSYSLYLVHLLVIPGTIVWLSRTAWYAALSRPAQFATFFAVYLAAATALALAVHVLVERPFLVVKDRIGDTGPAAVVSHHPDAARTPARPARTSRPAARAARASDR